MMMYVLVYTNSLHHLCVKTGPRNSDWHYVSRLNDVIMPFLYTHDSAIIASNKTGTRMVSEDELEIIKVLGV